MPRIRESFTECVKPNNGTPKIGGLDKKICVGCERNSQSRLHEIGFESSSECRVSGDCGDISK
jgi:hypothetical protein